MRLERTHEQAEGTGLAGSCATACPKSYDENSEYAQSVPSTSRCERLAINKLAVGAHRAELHAK